MSMMRFDVHVDKENAGSVHNIYRGKTLNTFVPVSGKNISESNKGKPTHLAQRKALTDVINDPASRNARGKESTVNKDELCSSLKCSWKSVCHVENVHENTDNAKGDFKKAAPSLQQHLKVRKDFGKPTSPQKKQKTQLKPMPASKATEEDYDTDSIFPASERLSSYVNRLLTWRPPCLFGALPDSESDTSDLEQLPDDILFDMQLPTATVPEFSDEDLANLMNDLPPQNPGFRDHKQDGFLEDKDIELSLDQTIDTSLTFGSLHVMHGSTEILDSSSSTDLDLSAT